jgi:eukaryotic-like serine/threonine-protein kinase
MNWNPGQILHKGEYTIERPLGSGRFAITYLTRRSNGERWVIKILDPQMLVGLAADERDRLETMFWQESVKLAKCRHPNIVRMETPFKENGVVCLPMEYVDGNSLGDRGESILPEAKALEYVRQIGEALEVVHSQKLVHRDVRPANIFLRNRDGQAVLTDFGLATDFESEMSKTRTIERMDGFSPIELYSRGKPVGAYTDVYSLAATLYELLTGMVPVSAIDREFRGMALVSPQVKNPAISVQTVKMILEGMELFPDKRVRSIQEWLKPIQITVPAPVMTDVNWTKWSTIVAALALLIAIFAMIPSWLALNKPDGQAQPKMSPSGQASP